MRAKKRIGIGVRLAIIMAVLLLIAAGSFVILSLRSFGIEAPFLATIGELLSIEISKVGKTVSQGIPFGAITNANMRVFNLRAPLSGRVHKVNQEAIENIDLIRADPRGRGWLLQVVPTGLENEIENLGP